MLSDRAGWAVGLVVALALAGCKDSQPAAPQRRADVVAPKPVAALPVVHCKKDWDCPDSGGVQSSCEYRCVQPEEGEGVCQLRRITTEVGVGPCIGHHLGNQSFSQLDGEPVSATAYLCEVSAGIYCDRAVHKCAPAKAPGAACQNQLVDECGLDGDCDAKTSHCVPRPRVGESCAVLACASDGFCNEKNVCVARLQNGAPCQVDSQCKSLYCNTRAGVCAAYSETKCPI